MTQRSPSLEGLRVPFTEPPAEALTASIRAEIERISAGRQLDPGPQVEAVEMRFARAMQCRHAVGVSSGTDALLLALMALRIGPGDEVITSPFAPVAGAAAIVRAGARPVFCDIDPETYNLSAAEVDEFIERCCEMRNDGRAHRLVNRRTGGRIKALLPVHLFGRLCEMGEFSELAHHFGLDVIEDVAQAVGAHDDLYAPAGSFGSIGCFSFAPDSILGAFGDAGMCVTNDSALAEQLRILRTQGASPQHHQEPIGGNFRLDEVQAAVLNVKLDALQGFLRMRDFNAHLYTELLADKFSRGGVVPPEIWRVGQHVFSRYVIRAQDRDGLHGYLGGVGIRTEIENPVPLHRQPGFAPIDHGTGDLPQAELAARETLSLPMHPQLTAPQIEHVVAAIEAFYKT